MNENEQTDKYRKRRVNRQGLNEKELKRVVFLKKCRERRARP